MSDFVHLSMKLGKGGFGMQAVDQNSQYTEDVKVSINGVQVDNLKSFIDEFLSQNGYNYKFDELPEDTQSQLAELLTPEYNKLLSSAIDDYNREHSPFRKFYDTADEIAKAMPVIFNKEMCEDFFKECGGKSEIKTNPWNSCECNSMCYLLQKVRYPRNKFNYMSEEEYQQIMATTQPIMPLDLEAEGSATSEHEKWNTEEVRRLESMEPIPVWRGISDVEGHRQEAYKSFVDEEDGASKTLLAGAGMYGTVIYISASKAYANDYAGYFSGRKSDDGILTHGIIQNDGNARILNAGPSYLRSSNESEQCTKDAVEAFGNAKQGIFDNLIKNGVAYSKAQMFLGALEHACLYDKGFQAMLKGYDIVLFDGHQIDLLNPKYMSISDEFE